MITIEQIMEQVDILIDAEMEAHHGDVDPFAEQKKLRAMIEQYRKEAVPDGWQLVPIEPNKEMLYFAKISASGFGSLDSFAAIYKSMLSAAPKPDFNLPELLKPQSPEY